MILNAVKLFMKYWMLKSYKEGKNNIEGARKGKELQVLEEK